MQNPQQPQNQGGRGRNYAQKKQRYDRFGSTFRHIIHMDNGKPIEGYSKTEDKNEHPDKIIVLYNVVERVWFKNNYRGKAHRMEFFWQKQGLIKDDHPKVLTLTTSNFLMEPEILKWQALHKSLSKLFHFRGAGISINNLDDLMSTEKVLAAEKKAQESALTLSQAFSPLLLDDPFSTAPVFANGLQLYEYCVQLYEGGQPIGLVQKYYREMTTKYAERYGIAGQQTAMRM